MRDELPTLTPHERALLQRFRADETPSAAVSARVHRGLAAVLAAPVSAASPIGWLYWARAGLMSVSIAAGTLLVVGGTARVMSPMRDAAPLQAADQAVVPAREQAIVTVPVEPPIVAAPSTAVVSPPVVEPVTPMEAPAVENKSTTKTPRGDRASTKPEAAPPAVDNDAAEIALFGEIKRNGNASDRLASIARYRKSFPQGSFVAEIGVIEIETLCGAGRTDDANARAREFLARFGDSAYAAIARRGCQDAGR